MPDDLKAALRASLTVIENDSRQDDPVTTDTVEENAAVVDLSLERIERGDMSCQQVTPEQVLRLALRELDQTEGITKCYVTLIQETPEGPITTINMRSRLSRQEEVAFRQLGVHEAIDSWRA